MLKQPKIRKVKATDYAVINKHTGEVVADYELKASRSAPHVYVLTFFNAIADRGLTITPVMLKIIGLMNGTNRVMLDKERRETICRKLHINDNIVKIAISRMCKAGMMKKIGNGCYFANPYYFSKSNLRNVNKLRKEYAELEYTTMIKKKVKKPIVSTDNVIKLGQKAI